MKVCVVIHSLGCGGAERVATEIAAHLAERHDVTLVTFSSGAERFYEVNPRVTFVPLNVAHNSKGSGEAVIANLRRTRRLRQTLRAIQPDCVLALGDRTNVTVLLAARGTGIPIVISERIDPRWSSPGRAWERLRTLTYPAASLLVVQTRGLEDWARRTMRSERITVIPNAARPPRLAGIPQVQLPSGNFILAIGRLVRQKGFDLLLQAFAEIKDLAPDWSLVILGEGELRPDLERIIVERKLQDRVSLPGLARDPGPVLARAGMFVLSSRFEGFPNALLEAMAAGLPVVAANCPSGPSEIVANGHNGVLVEPESALKLGEALLALIHDPVSRSRMGNAARSVIERFSNARCMDLWESALTHVAQPRRKSPSLTLRKPAIRVWSRLRGLSYLDHYRRCLELDQTPDSRPAMDAHLEAMLEHCRRHVPYYAALLRDAPSKIENPFDYLLHLPLLTKADIRQHFQALESADIGSRKCFVNTSGGSTGEPVRLIQDREYSERSRAVTLMQIKWTGKELGDPEILLWGSERDVFAGTEGLRARLRNRLLNRRILNAFLMTPERMREYVRILNRSRPRLIIAYAQAIYELAQFAEQEGIHVEPQNAILTSAGTLYPFMREKIESVFHAEVFNRYGSREVGDMAFECCTHKNLHVAPMGHVIEVVDEHGLRVPNGVEGNIVVTCLSNFAMPLVRYQIGDRGVMSTDSSCACGRRGQMLRSVLGRDVDAFCTADGSLIDGEYFTHLLYFRDWVKQFQVVQRSVAEVEFSVIPLHTDVKKSEMDEIVSKTRLVLGSECAVHLRFVDHLPPSPSGKFRYTISQVAR